jgi:uncharacterized protein YaiI (UPF0178 family)
MQIWVDADACPGAVKDIVYRAADRLAITTTLVANSFLRPPPSSYVRTLQVEKGLDVADAKIAQLMEPGDLVITADIPLAAIVIDKGGHALNPRGEFYTVDNIRETLSMRNFMESLRQGGVETGGPAPFGMADRQAFGNQLDRFLAQHAPGKPG